jgi:hypothetical protein
LPRFRARQRDSAARTSPFCAAQPLQPRTPSRSTAASRPIALTTPEISSQSVLMRSSSAGTPALARSRTPPFVLQAFAAGRSQRHEDDRAVRRSPGVASTRFSIASERGCRRKQRARSVVQDHGSAYVGTARRCRRAHSVGAIGFGRLDSSRPAAGVSPVIGMSPERSPATSRRQAKAIVRGSGGSSRQAGRDPEPELRLLEPRR